MTEAEWISGDNLAGMLKAVRWNPSGRKSRLLVCGWCRQRWDVLDPCYQESIGVGERFADGNASDAELDSARNTATRAREKMYGVYFAYARQIKSSEAVNAAAHLSQYPYGSTEASYRDLIRRGQIPLVRDIFGNPFRPVALDPAWRTPTAVGLAQAIYDERAFDRLPILADALQDAGCEDADVLAHCRGDGPHVRGCWVVDLVLGKE